MTMHVTHSFEFQTVLFIQGLSYTFATTGKRVVQLVEPWSNREVLGSTPGANHHDLIYFQVIPQSTLGKFRDCAFNLGPSRLQGFCQTSPPPQLFSRTPLESLKLI